MGVNAKPLIVYLVRHAHPVAPGAPGHEENDRPLSTRGRADAESLAAEFADRIDAIYSSPYPRARQTVEPLARRFGLAIETIDDLRERVLSTAPLTDWRAHLARSWSDFDYATADGESSRVAQQRVLGVLEEIRARHSDGGSVMLASHGNLIALALHSFDARVDFDFWEAIPLPAVFRLDYTSTGWRIVSAPNIR
jgi:2,3-bisphosphoglycerate-dependent phosphoglycerate mutase